MKLIRAMLSEIKMDLVSAVRYRFGFISDMTVFTIFLAFLMLSNSGVSLAEKYSYADYKGLLLYGYIGWMLAIAAISTASNEIKNELQRGTFYLKMNSRYPIVVLYIGKLIAAIVIQLVITVIIAVLAKLIWKVALRFNAMILAALIISTFGMFGIGLLIAGVALLHKRTGALTLIVQMGLLFITDTVPTSDLLAKITQVVPLISCNEVIRKSLAGTSDTRALILLIAFSALWLAIGIIAFNLCLKKAKKNGNLLMY